MKPGYFKKVDSNHATVVQGLRDAGASVTSTASLGRGFPDLVVGYGGMTILMEIKLPISPFVKGGFGGKRERRADEYDPREGFTDAEIKFHREWRGQPIVTVRSIEDALKAIGVV